MRRAGLAALAALALGAGPASAAPTWLAPDDLSPASTGAPEMRILAGGGETRVLWTAPGLGTSGSARLDGSVWQAPTPLSTPGVPTSSPDMALAPDGDLIAVWLAEKSGVHVVQTVSGSSTFGWSSPYDVTPLGVDAEAPRVAATPASTMVMWWRTVAGPIVELEGRFVRADGSSDGVVVSLTPPQATVDDRRSADVAFDAIGGATVVWRHARGDGTEQIVAADRRADGSWSSLAQLSAPFAPSADDADPRVVLDAAGNAVATWSADVGGGVRAQAAVRPAGGTWGLPQSLSAPASTVTAPVVGFDAQGNAVAAWRWEARVPSVEHRVQVATRARGGAWQPAVDLSTLQSTASPDLAVNGAGDAEIVWPARTSPGNERIVQAAHRVGPAGSWTVRPVTASGPVDLPRVGLDAQGNAAAVFQRDDSTPAGPAYRVQAAGLDAVGPRVTLDAAPTSATVGELLRFSATPFDTWTPIAGTRWSFGDGQELQGTTALHAFAAPGTYPVTVTAVDGLGNVTSVGTTVTVAAFPAGPTTPPPTPPSTPVTPPARTPKRDGPSIGVSQLPRLDASAKLAVLAAGDRVLSVATLTVSRVPKGATVTVLCSGRGCPFKASRRTPKRSGTLTYPAFGRHALHAWRIRVYVTKDDRLGIYKSWQVEKNMRLSRFKRLQVERCATHDSDEPVPCSS